MSWVDGRKIKHRLLCGKIFKEDEVITQFVRLTDDFNHKQEAIEWIESIMEEITERKEGD